MEITNIQSFSVIDVLNMSTVGCLPFAFISSTFILTETGQHAIGVPRINSSLTSPLSSLKVYIGLQKDTVLSVSKKV